MYIIKTFLECLRHITALFAFCQGRRILCLSTLPSFYGELQQVFFSPSVYISRFSFSPLDNLLAILYIQNHMYTAINQTQVSEKERLSMNEFDRLDSSQPALRTTARIVVKKFQRTPSPARPAVRRRRTQNFASTAAP